MHYPPLAVRLDREWAALRRSRRSLDAARRWRSTSDDHPLDRVLDVLVDLDEIVRATHRGSGGPGDDERVIARLVAIAGDDDLACRLLVQRLLPGLICRARDYRTYGADDQLEQAVPALCMAIRTFDLQRRGSHIASRLISDAVYEGLRKPLRRRSATEVVRSPWHFADATAEWDGPGGGPHAGHEPTAVELLAEAVREARLAGVDRCDLDLVRELVSDPSALVAWRRQVTPRTIRNRRTRAAANIRTAIGAAA